MIEGRRSLNLNANRFHAIQLNELQKNVKLLMNLVQISEIKIQFDFAVIVFVGWKLSLGILDINCPRWRLPLQV